MISAPDARGRVMDALHDAVKRCPLGAATLYPDLGNHDARRVVDALVIAFADEPRHSLAREPATADVKRKSRMTLLPDDDHPGILIRAAEDAEIAASAHRGAISDGLTDDAGVAEWAEKKARTFRAAAAVLYSAARSSEPAIAEGERAAPMPECDDRGLWSEAAPEGYLESDRDWCARNTVAVTWLIDNHAAIRAVLAQSSTPPASKAIVALNQIADLGSCAAGKAPAHKLLQQAIDIATGAL